MIISDYESQELNKVLEEQALESCVREAQGDILNLKDAKHKIHIMVQAITSKNNQIQKLKRVQTANYTMLEGWESKYQLLESLLEESYGFRKFYQAMLLKMVRDMKLLESSPETMQKFRTINENLEVHKY